MGEEIHFDYYAFNCVNCYIAVLGNHYGHRLAKPPNPVPSKDRALKSLHALG
jgi:hypothetical protein